MSYVKIDDAKWTEMMDDGADEAEALYAAAEKDEAKGEIVFYEDADDEDEEGEAP